MLGVDVCTKPTDAIHHLIRFFLRKRHKDSDGVCVSVCGLSISNVISKSILLTISKFLLNLLYIVACEFVVEKVLWMRSVNANFPAIPIGNIKSSKLLLEFQSKAFRLNFCTHVNYTRIKYCKLTRIRSYFANKHFWFYSIEYRTHHIFTHFQQEHNEWLLNLFGQKCLPTVLVENISGFAPQNTEDLISNIEVPQIKKNNKIVRHETMRLVFGFDVKQSKPLELWNMVL